MAALQLQQQDPALAASTASPPTSRNAQRAGVGAAVPSTVPGEWIPRRGQADQRRGTREQLDRPSSLRPDVPREEYDAWYGRSVMPGVCMLMGCLKGP